VYFLLVVGEVSKVEALTRVREPKLWWVAGADSRILAECPRADQIFVQHLGISLVGAFLFVFLISAISILVAFPTLAGNVIGVILAIGTALLIATMVFLIDRLFIQSDWIWQASKQRKEGSRTTWESFPLYERLSGKGRDSSWTVRAGRVVQRFVVVLFRVLLAAIIPLTIASLLELVMYKDEIKTIIQRLHYEDNRAIYDDLNTRTARLDPQIATSRAERDRLLNTKNQLTSELLRMELTPTPLASDRTIASLDAQIAELRNKITQEEANIRRYARDIDGEFRGTTGNPDSAGAAAPAGPDQRYWTAMDLRSLSESTIADLRKKIADLEAEKTRALSTREAEQRTANGQMEARRTSLRTRLTGVIDALSTAQATVSNLEADRDSAIESLRNKPNFVPLSFGIASQFRALRTLYGEYGSAFEMGMIKLLIMMLAMMPVLQKVFFSPTTLYALKLDAAKRTRTQFDEQLRSRQDTLRRRASVAREEAEARAFERFRPGEVTALHEARASRAAEAPSRAVETPPRAPVAAAN
jgi:Domain of unknown function (DUF4407)